MSQDPTPTPADQFAESRERWTSLAGYILSIESFYDTARRVLPPELFVKVETESAKLAQTLQKGADS